MNPISSRMVVETPESLDGDLIARSCEDLDVLWIGRATMNMHHSKHRLFRSVTVAPTELFRSDRLKQCYRGKCAIKRLGWAFE